MVKVPELLWAAGEAVPIVLQVTHAPAEGGAGLSASAQVLDDHFQPLWRQQRTVTLKPGPSRETLDLGKFVIPAYLEDRFFFMLAELRRSDQTLISRSVSWPRCLRMMADPAWRARYRTSPQPTPFFHWGPWLKRQVAGRPTTLEVRLVSTRSPSGLSQYRLSLRNGGPYPAFLTRVDVVGARRLFYAADNFFWLAPGERRLLDLVVSWRESLEGRRPSIVVSAFNAGVRRVPIS